jgi:hypothetical protein
LIADLNLKLKFTLVICALLVLSTVALGWMVGLQVEESALRELKEKGEVVARGLADASVLGILTYSPDLLQAALDPLKKTDDVVYAGIADERGVVHAQHRMEEISRVPDWTSGSVTRIGALIEEGGTGRLKSGAPVYFFSVPILTDPGASNGEELGMLLGEDLPSTPSSRVGSICILSPC